MFFCTSIVSSGIIIHHTFPLSALFMFANIVILLKIFQKLYLDGNHIYYATIYHVSHFRVYCHLFPQIITTSFIHNHGYISSDFLIVDRLRRAGIKFGASQGASSWAHFTWRNSITKRRPPRHGHDVWKQQRKTKTAKGTATLIFERWGRLFFAEGGLRWSGSIGVGVPLRH